MYITSLTKNSFLTVSGSTPVPTYYPRVCMYCVLSLPRSTQPKSVNFCGSSFAYALATHTKKKDDRTEQTPSPPPPPKFGSHAKLRQGWNSKLGSCSSRSWQSFRAFRVLPAVKGIALNQVCACGGLLLVPELAGAPFQKKEPHAPAHTSRVVRLLALRQGSDFSSRTIVELCEQPKMHHSRVAPADGRWRRRRRRRLRLLLARPLLVSYVLCSSYKNAADR